MDKLDMNAMVSYNATSDTLALGGNASSIYVGDFGWDYWRQYPETIKEYYPYPVYYGTTRYEDNYKKAFNIAKLLLKKNLLVSRKLKDFIGLVEEIVKEL
jgi:hypothetical protein